MGNLNCAGPPEEKDAMGQVEHGGKMEDGLYISLMNNMFLYLESLTRS